MVNGDVKDASEFGALGSLRKALVERKRGQCLVASSTLDMAGCYFFFSACFSETKESLPTFPQPAQQIELLNGREINYYYFPFPTNISLSNKYFSNMTSNYFPFPTNISPCNFWQLNISSMQYMFSQYFFVSVQLYFMERHNSSFEDATFFSTILFVPTISISFTYIFIRNICALNTPGLNTSFSNLTFLTWFYH